MTGAALVYSSSLIAAFLGGILALFAPCCVVSLMPTFVGGALRQGRRRLPLTTAVFAAGVAAVLLPVVLGVAELGQLLGAQHRLVYLAVAVVLLALGVATIFGRGLTLPMPKLRYRTSTAGGVGQTFVLGLVSGVVSSCCAPVLVGVIALSALAASPLGGLGLGLSYVFGMVFPLFVAALLWDRLNLGPWFMARRWPHVTIFGAAVNWTDLLAGAIFIAMGSLALVVAVSGKSTLTPDALVEWTRWASGVAGTISLVLGRLPIVAQAGILALLAAGIATSVIASARAGRPPGPEPTLLPRGAQDSAGRMDMENEHLTV